MIQSLKFTGVEGREVGPLKRALQNKIKRNVFSLQKFAKLYVIVNLWKEIESVRAISSFEPTFTI